MGLEETIKKSEIIQTNIKQKNMLEFLKSIEKYLTAHDKNLLNEYINVGNRSWYSFSNELDIFKVVGDSFSSCGLIDAFSTISNDKLKDPDSREYIKNSIINDRIKYYKLIEVYDEKIPPEQFLMGDIAIKNTPSQEFMDEIISKKQMFSDFSDEEIIRATSTYEDNKKRINELNLLDNPDFTPTMIKEGIHCMSPSAKIVNGEIQSVALLLFSFEDCLPNYVDTFFIHEINHAIELSLLNSNEKDGSLNHKCGFEVLNSKSDETRKYESFSENINQMIAIEITEAMHRDGKYLFDDPRNAKTRGGSSYEDQSIFTSKFFEKFKKVIMKSRVENNLESLFSVIGKEEFDALNNTINDYVELPFYEMMDDVIENKKTSLTEKRAELIGKSNDIYQRMLENSNRYEDSDIKTI